MNSVIKYFLLISISWASIIDLSSFYYPNPKDYSALQILETQHSAILVVISDVQNSLSKSEGLRHILIHAIYLSNKTANLTLKSVPIIKSKICNGSSVFNYFIASHFSTSI
ncbi:MAG: hypothetical protein KJ799_15625 [Bacteroidetes bacterium]|nr:hypothetical protein [Bacteroidota bacterium]MBU1679918.1 hypothetical protein [Bacteroidota bacterium]MBU2508132.1 hypothetical protein [Bacteroidota bacterium]